MRYNITMPDNEQLEDKFAEYREIGLLVDEPAPISRVADVYSICMYCERIKLGETDATGEVVESERWVMDRGLLNLLKQLNVGHLPSHGVCDYCAEYDANTRGIIAQLNEA